MFTRTFFKIALLVAATSAMTMDYSNLSARQAGYQLPPQEVVDIIDAAPEPSVSFSPDKNWMLLMELNAMPSIEDISRRMLRLAGTRIDPQANSRFQTSFGRGLILQSRDGTSKTRVPLAASAKLSSVSWSHKSNAFCYTIVTENGTQLWSAKTDSPDKPKKIVDQLSTVMGSVEWLPNGTALLAHLVPSDRGVEPTENNKPVGPNIQESSGSFTPTRTYQDLLSNPYDSALFKYYATSQLAKIGLDGNTSLIGKPAIFSSVDSSPDGKHVLVSTLQTPYSYLMTYRSFPHNIEVWNLDGDLQYTVANVPMAESIPIEGVRTGPRSVHWKSGDLATLIWTEALDGGDPNREIDFRDRFMSLSTPFDENPQEILKTQYRAFGMSYMADPASVMVTEYDRDRRWIRVLMHHTDRSGETPTVLMDRSARDRYGDPGNIVSRLDDSGHAIARQDGDYIYRMGSGSSPKGDLPFIDRQNLKTMETERLWQCKEGSYERPVSIVSSDVNFKPVIVTSSESPQSPPNFYLRDLDAGSVDAITQFSDPTPQIRGIKKQLVKYERADGVPLSATLYLPANYEEGQRLPLMVWAYPREFSDAKTAGQVSGSPNRFTRMRSITHLTLLTQGYAIMDAATMPVIGDPETMNDTFIEQIVGAAKAAIDKAVDMGVADPNRVGVGGHSYGAFMTANLLAHSDLFKAGIARSGAYNRTLTPFGFQSERRSFWDAKNIYFNISPFMHANKISEPLLLIHGENDNNSGTFPMQSKRMYQAVKGNGGIVRLVMLPYESHGYRARESVLHTQAELISWFDEHVKNAK